MTSDEQPTKPSQGSLLAGEAPSSKVLPSAWIDRIFELFTGYYGKHFLDMWSGANVASVKSVWSAELGRLTPQAIALGMDACRRRKFPPTLPEFLELCRPTPESLGIPAKPLAFNEALAIACGRKRREECSHAVVWHALAEAGDLGHMSHKDARDVFGHCYDATVDMAIKGEPLREIPKALPKPEDVRVQSTPEQRKAAADAAMARLAEMGLDVRKIAKPMPEASP